MNVSHRRPSGRKRQRVIQRGTHEDQFRAFRSVTKADLHIRHRSDFRHQIDIINFCRRNGLILVGTTADYIAFAFPGHHVTEGKT